MNLSDVASAVAVKLLAKTGSSWTYKRGIQTATLTLFKSDQPPVVIDQGNGLVIEATVVSFRGKVSDFTAFEKPKNGDKITDGTATFEVMQLGDKCYYTVGGLMHIHTKQVAG